MSIDEPSLGGTGAKDPEEGRDPDPIPERILGILRQEPYAVLCTQGEGQPYGSLIGFAASPDGRCLVFATPVFTRKYSLLKTCPQVALLVDTRARHRESLMEVEGVTATGRALEVTGEAAAPWAELLLGRHPDFATFLRCDSSALFRVEIARFFYVRRFQEVHEWVPPGA
jgi:uncharacterized protein YhbP (UPF0306 family)